MREKRGITFLNLIAGIVILIIFASSTTVATISIVNNSKKQQFAIELAQIQEAVNDYYTTNNNFPVTEEETIDLSNVVSSDKDQFSIEEGYPNEITLYKLNLAQVIPNVETVYGNNKDDLDIYTVSLKTGKVYYLKGVAVSSKTYFTLNDELKRKINYTEKNNSESAQEETIIDNTAPQIENGDSLSVSTMQSSEDGTTYRYIAVGEITDDKSGVKLAKFERENLDLSTSQVYFKSNGIDIQNDIIEVYDNTKYVTIYLEDNNGNARIYNIQCSEE